jgi:hypothetical protein
MSESMIKMKSIHSSDSVRHPSVDGNDSDGLENLGYKQEMTRVCTAPPAQFFLFTREDSREACSIFYSVRRSTLSRAFLSRPASSVSWCVRVESHVTPVH